MIIRRRADRNNRRGYSLPELLLGAAVIAAFMLRVYQSYSATSESDKYENFIGQLTAISAQTIAESQATPDYTDINNLNVSGHLPESMVQSVTATDAILVTSYRQQIRIKPVNTALGGVTTTNTGLQIHAVIPQGACFRLAMAAPQVFGFMAVSTSGSGEVAFPFDNDVASGLCGATDGTALKDVWLYIVPAGGTVASY